MREQINKKTSKKRNLKIIIGIISIFLLLSVVGILVYIQDYYHSAKTFNEYQKEYSITLEEKKSIITLSPTQSNGIGIIFYPGGKVEAIAYIPLLEPLAELGYTCYIQEMPVNLAVFGVNKANEIIEKNTEIKTWYLAGHSLGGAMASSYASKNQNKLSGIILLGAYPAADLSNSNLTMISIVGSNDMVVNREKLEESKINAPSNAMYYNLEGGNHGGFGDYGHQEGDGESSITNMEQIEQTVDLIHEFCGNTK